MDNLIEPGGLRARIREKSKLRRRSPKPEPALFTEVFIPNFSQTETGIIFPSPGPSLRKPFGKIHHSFFMRGRHLTVNGRLQIRGPFPRGGMNVNARLHA
jgi:hypothetical protein